MGVGGETMGMGGAMELRHGGDTAARTARWLKK